MITLFSIFVMIYYWRDVKDDHIPIYASTFLATIIGIELITNLSFLNLLSTGITNIYTML